MDHESDWPDTGDEAQLAPFDATDYPRAYGLRLLWRALLVLLGLALAAAAAALLAADGTPVLVTAAAVLGVVGALCLIDAWRTRVVLHTDVIDVTTLRGRRSVRLDEIAGRRQLSRDGAGVPVVVLGAGRRRVVLPPGLAIDRAFAAWFERVPDLDARDSEALFEAVAANASLGSTAEQRLRRFESLRTAVRVALPVIAGLLVWSMLAPQLPLLALVGLGAAPWLVLGVVVLARGLLRLGGHARDVRPDLLGVFALACLALLPRLLVELNLGLERSWTVVSAALAGGAALCWCVLRLSRTQTSEAARWPAIAPWVTVYCAAVLAWVNVLADRGPATVERTTVASKHAGGRRTLQFSLGLEPWGAHRAPVTLKVSQRVFNSLSPGEAACVREHAGLLGWPWVEVQPCALADLARVPAGMPEPIYRALKLRALREEQRGPLLQLLVQQRYSELDERLQEEQRRFEAGEFGSEVLLALYRDFYDPDPDLDALFDAWIAGHPQSYPAALARGIHRKYQAERLHAAGYERWVSPNVNVEQHADRQLLDLERSTRLTARPALSYVHMMDAAMHRRQREQMRQWFERGLAVEPDSLMLRRKYLAMLRPMYGGSLREMEDFVAEVRAGGAPQRVQDTLQAMLLTQQGWILQERRETDAALALFRQAAALSPYSEDLHAALQAEATILNQRRQFDTALQVLQRAREARADVGRTYTMTGYALQELGRRAESIEWYMRGAQMGDAPAQSYIGRLYLLGEAGVPQDTAQAARLLGLAAASGDADAKRLLRENPALSNHR